MVSFKYEQCKELHIIKYHSSFDKANGILLLILLIITYNSGNCNLKLIYASLQLPSCT